MYIWFSKNNLPGSAAWCWRQSKEERKHGLRFLNHLIERRQQPQLNVSSELNGAEYLDTLSVWKTAFEMERQSSKDLHQVFKLSREEDDFTTESFLKFFIDEQVKEELEVDEIWHTAQYLNQVKGLYFNLDKQLSQKSVSKKKHRQLKKIDCGR